MRVPVIALVLASAAPVAAHADIYQFVVTDPDSTLSGQPFSPYTFTIDTSVAPASYDADTFTYDGITTGSTFAPVSIFDSYTFYDATSGGGFQDLENVYEGQSLFTGPTSAPVFLTGTFTLDDYVNPVSVVITDLTTPATPGVPEPATWAMMIGGFGLIGASLRGQRRAVVFAA